jgi:hypothetical protein
MNKFGTGANGKSKACQNRLVLALLPPDATKETPLALLDISPTAIPGFTSYVSTVARAVGRPPYGVITQIDCDPDSRYDVVRFSDPEPIAEADLIAMIRSRKQEAREMLLTEPDVNAMVAANDAKSKARPLIRKQAGRR